MADDFDMNAYTADYLAAGRRWSEVLQRIERLVAEEMGFPDEEREVIEEAYRLVGLWNEAGEGLRPKLRSISPPLQALLRELEQAAGPFAYSFRRTHAARYSAAVGRRPVPAS